MGLNFLRSSKKHELIPEAKKLLMDYMAGAVKEIGFVKKGKAEEKANDYAEDFHKSGKDVGLTKADIKAMEKQVAKELKKYGLKERFNYATNIRAAEENMFKATLGSLGACTLMGAAAVVVSLGGQPEVGVGVLGATAAIAVAKSAAFVVGASNNEEEKRKIEEYTELKHAQLALKQLKQKIGKGNGPASMEIVRVPLVSPRGGYIYGHTYEPKDPVLAAKLKNQGR